MTQDKIRATIEESIRTKQRFLETCTDALQELCRVAVAVIGQGGKIMLCGNGGSSCDAAHAVVGQRHHVELGRRPCDAHVHVHRCRHVRKQPKRPAKPVG